MQTGRNSTLIYGLLLGVWVLVLAWQVEEHVRVREIAQNALRKRSEAIANTIGAVVRGQQFRGAVFRDRLEPVLDELVASSSNELASAEVVSIEMLNFTNGVMAAAGRPIDLQQPDILQAGEHWGSRTMTRVYPVEGVTNTVIVEATNFMRGPRGSQRREPPPNGMGMSDTNGLDTNAASQLPPPPPDDRGGPPRDGEPRPQRRPFWARDLNDQQYQEMVATHELHGLLLTISTQSLQAFVNYDIWLRCIIVFFAGISAAGAGLALRNVSKTCGVANPPRPRQRTELAPQGNEPRRRRPRARDAQSAQHHPRPRADAFQADRRAADIREKTRVIMDETDKVTAQLTEFINYSRPREVRRSKIALNSAFAEVVRTLNHDIEEKKIRVETSGEPLSIEADEQLLRQVLFNLLINAIQAVNEGGQIQIVARRESAAEASLEIRDDGPAFRPDSGRKFSSRISPRTRKAPASASPSCRKSSSRTAGKFNASPTRPRAPSSASPI